MHTIMFTLGILEESTKGVVWAVNIKSCRCHRSRFFSRCCINTDLGELDSQCPVQPFWNLNPIWNISRTLTELLLNSCHFYFHRSQLSLRWEHFCDGYAMNTVQILNSACGHYPGMSGILRIMPVHLRHYNHKSIMVMRSCFSCWIVSSFCSDGWRVQT